MSDQAERLRAIVAQNGAAVEGRPAPGGCRILVVTSGKGGVGKTNVTVNLALALAGRGRRTILFDADLGMANVDVLLGVSPPHNLIDVIRGTKRLDEVLFKVTDHLSVVPGGSGIAELADLDQGQLDGFVHKLAELEGQADVILVDTGAGIARNVLNFVMAASEVLVVTTPEPTAITDAYGMIKAIDHQNPEARVQLLINMAEGEHEAKAVARKLIAIVERFLSVKVGYLGFLERDANVNKAVLQQKPVLRAFPHSLAARRINLIAGALLVQEAAGDRPRGTFFSRLVGLFR